MSKRPSQKKRKRRFTSCRADRKSSRCWADSFRPISDRKMKTKVFFDGKSYVEKAVAEEEKAPVYVVPRGPEIKQVLGGFIQANFRSENENESLFRREILCRKGRRRRRESAGLRRAARTGNQAGAGRIHSGQFQIGK